ncbi:MAG: hypothetical protein OXE42_16920 [Gammaproteobacteria bacterium]|nr:hypothetical protein [Gammaproteobacteria bacterium]
MTETKSQKATAGHYQAVMKDSLIFDSHEYVKRMTSGGFNEQQAETLAAEQADLLNNLATKRDIETVKDDLEIVKNDLETVKQNMATKDELEEVKKNMATRQDIEVSAQTLKVEMIKWMTWYFLSGLAVMIAVLKLT